MRQNFAIVKKAYTKLGKGNVRLTQSNLFLIRPISATTTTYNFPVTENELIGLVPDEIRLNINDEFIATHVGIYLRGSFVDGRAPLVIAPLLHTYAPIQQDGVFIASSGLYDGLMRISVNNINFVDKWGIRKHEVRPVNSQWNNGSLVIAGANPVGSAEATADFSKDGVYSVSPMVTFSGAKKNEVQIVLPRAITGSAGAFLDNAGNSIALSIDSIAINFFGYLGQNGAKFQ